MPKAEYFGKHNIILYRIGRRVQVFESVYVDIDYIIDYDLPFGFDVYHAVRSCRYLGNLLCVAAVGKPAPEGIPSSRRRGESNGFVLYGIKSGV